ncbi:MAG: exodeoxyribonuclease VII large subunit [Bacteroidota bacterium]|jgi:exodeoxyribonuclease VII large subunit
MNNTPLKLTQLQDLVRGTLEAAFQGQSWWVIADADEIDDRGSIIYLTFIEKGSDNAPAARFAGWVNNPDALTRFRNFEDITGKLVRDLRGLQVLVRVTVTLHRTAGLRLNVLDIDPHFMLGQLEQQRQETYRKLAAKPGVQLVNGRWQTPNKQLELPAVIQHIAVITSASAAGFEDFSHKLRNDTLQYGFVIEGFFAQLQGEGAAESMRDQLLAVYERSRSIRFDVVVIIRGGGAQSDLLPFDSFSLAWPVAKFPIPVITGIGHQRNESITDTMAHTALKTPTEAAQFIIDHNLAYETELDEIYQRILQHSSRKIAAEKLMLEKTSAVLAGSIRKLLSEHAGKLTRTETTVTSGSKNLLRNAPVTVNRLQEQIAAGAQRMNRNAATAIAQLQQNIKQSAQHNIERSSHELTMLTERVRLLHPDNVLRRGYAYVTQQNSVITAVSKLDNEKEIIVHFHDGTATTQLNSISINE